MQLRNLAPLRDGGGRWWPLSAMGGTPSGRPFTTTLLPLLREDLDLPGEA